VTERGAAVVNFPFLYGMKYCRISTACLQSAGQVSSDINSLYLTQIGYNAIDERRLLFV
jgi:hypothetical protein